jgi:hypothetical protein
MSVQEYLQRRGVFVSPDGKFSPAETEKALDLDPTRKPFSRFAELMGVPDQLAETIVRILTTHSNRRTS